MAKTQESQIGVKIMSLVKLELLTNDESLSQLCELFWQVDEEGNFSYKTTELAKVFGITTKEMTKKVKVSCKALSTLNFCMKCGEAYIYSNRTEVQDWLRRPNREWLCEDCIAHERARERERQAALLERRGKLIGQKYGFDQTPSAELEQLSLENAVYLVSLVRLASSEDFSFIRQFGIITDLLSPRKNFDYEVLRHLYRSNLLFIHPGSPVEAFDFEEEEIKSFKLDKVFWFLPRGINGESPQRFIANIEDIFRTRSWPDRWQQEEVGILWKKIALEECLQYTEVILEEYKLPFNPGEKTNLVFNNVLEEYSVAQTYSFIWRAVKDAAAFYQRGGVTKQHAANTVVGAIQRQAERARSEGWQVKPFGRDFRCPQSMISQVLFNTVLQIGDAGFTQSPKIGCVSEW